jgi:methionine-gamma-lyase
MAARKEAPQTAVLYKGYRPDLSEGAAVPPVFRTSTFVFRNCQEGKSAFEIAYGLRKPNEGEIPALIYTRVNNPNVEIVEDRITVWDIADSAALFSSGMGAVSSACLTFLRPGDDAIFTDPVYGGTEFFFRHLLPQFGVTTRPIRAGCTEAELDAHVKAGGGKTRVIYIESPANPTITLTDIAMAARVASAHSTPDRKVVTVVDNTFIGPLFCRPHSFGADVVVYSATKFIGGHSDVVAGVATGSKALIEQIKGIRTIFGSCSDPVNQYPTLTHSLTRSLAHSLTRSLLTALTLHTPQDAAWLILRSLGTLELRMRAQAENAVKVVAALEAHPAIEKVYYPGRPIMGEDQLRIFSQQCSGPGSLVTFFVKGGEKEAFTVLDNLHHVRLAVSLGGIESLASHPSSMTHSDMTAEEKIHAGITENLVRLSVGLEDTRDLIDDLNAALDMVVPRK